MKNPIFHAGSCKSVTGVSEDFSKDGHGIIDFEFITGEDFGCVKFQEK